MLRENFNRNWKMKKVSVDLVASTMGGSTPPKEICVTLPHDAMVMETRDAKSPAGGACGFYTGGDYEYTKVFHVDESEADLTFILEFEGIYNRGYVYVNGALAGTTHYGYTGTFLDVTPYLHFGADNVVLVKAMNSDVPNSRWYTGSGIYRPVYLYKGGSVRVEADGLLVSTPEVSAKMAAVKALLDACDRLGMLVMEESYDTWTQAKSQFDSSLVFKDNWEKDIEDIVRKDFNHPSVFMYSIGNEITNLGTADGAKWSRRLADKVHELDPTRYVTNAINGMITIMDNLPMVMVDLGLLTPEQLQAMTVAASDGEDTENTAATESAAAGNAADDASKQERDAGGINDVMTSLLGQMNYLSTHPDVEKSLSEAYGTLDLIGMNYMRDAYDQMKDYPNRIFYGSETLPPDIDLNWKKVKEYPACIGDYTWTAWDYIGEAGVGIVTYDGKLVFSKGYPAYLAYCGDIDITGYRRPLSYLREIVFGLRKAPYVAVQLPEHYGQEPMCTPWSLPACVSSWTWNGFEGKPCMVEVYSDAPEVELFVNQKSVGRLPAGEDHRFRAVFDTVYEPGEVKAVAYHADGGTESFCLRTAENENILTMTADRKKIGQDDLLWARRGRHPRRGRGRSHQADRAGGGDGGRVHGNHGGREISSIM